MQTTGSVSLYFHIPFCKKKCPYCHFYVLSDSKENQKKLFSALIGELEQKAPFLQKKTIVSIYFGGGTPFLLDLAYLEKILEKIFSSFCIAKDIEITIEANPEDITFPKLQSLKKIKINRLSIGVQSLDEKVLQTLGRNHSSKDIKKAMKYIEDSDFFNVSIDLMYDIPHQSKSSWINTLRNALNFPITHLSLYNLTFEPNTPFFRKKEKLIPFRPNEKDSLFMLEKAIQYFIDHQFEQYEISAFAKKGFVSKHNTGYWIGRPFLGLGPSAFSFWDFERFKNVSNLIDYVKKIKMNQSTIDFKEKLTPSKRLNEQLAIHLRLIQGIDRKSFEKRWGSFSLKTKKALNKLCSLDLVHLTCEKVQLTKKGLFFYDLVAQEII